MHAALREARGRFAPSPTGGLHLGSALTALVAWLSVRSQNGTFIWRIEDIDGPRVIPDAAKQQMDEARWLGLNWDEGPLVGGPHEPYKQSERGDHYERALAELANAGHLFPCMVSRKDLQKLASAPHGADGLPPYPKSLRPSRLNDDWYDAYLTEARPDAALRFLVDDGLTTFDDFVQGPQKDEVAESTGDFVLKRRDGVYAYQLAVVVDDLEMGVTEIVRGTDLLDSTPRQIQLIEALRGHVPTYAHIPLLVNDEGEKLSKRDEASTMSELRAEGISAEAITGWLAAAVGLIDQPRRIGPKDLVAQFSWDRVRSEPIPVPRDIIAQLKQLSS